MSPTWVFVLSVAAMLVAGNGQPSVKPVVKTVKGKKVCDKGWECKGWSAYCCNETISDYFQTYQFENLFAKRNSPVAHAVGFWDYRSFITAAALYQPLGFGTTGGTTSGQKEVAAFLGHVGSKTSCESLFFHISIIFFHKQRKIMKILESLYKKLKTPPHTKTLNFTTSTKETKLFQPYLYLTTRTSNFYSHSLIDLIRRVVRDTNQNKKTHVIFSFLVISTYQIFSCVIMKIS